jgi:hypothetical protein
MRNDHTYFAIVVDKDGNLRKDFPPKIYTMNYMGIELFCYSPKLGQWHLYEKTTGLQVAASQFSKIDAFKQGRERINADGSQKVIEDIKIRQKALKQMTIYEKIEEI